MQKNNIFNKFVDKSCVAWQLLESKTSWLWVFLVSFVWLSGTTWMYPLLQPDEARDVQIALNMLASGNYLNPNITGVEIFDQPPLFYWLTAIFLSIFGENAWAARLSSVLAACLLTSFIYVFLRRYTNVKAAKRTAIILLAQPFLYGGAHYASLDMLAASLMGLTVLAGADAAFRFEQIRSERLSLFMLYVAAAGSFLAQGLIGIVLPALILFFWLVGRRNFASLVRLLWWPGIVLFLLLILPWIVLMQIQFPGFYNNIIHQYFLNLAQPDIHNQQPFWFFLPVILILTLPWSVQLWRWFYPNGPLHPVFLPPAARLEQVQRPVMRGLMLSWLAVVLIAFSIPSAKLVGYVIAALPPLAWFIQETFEQRIAEKQAVERSFVRHILISVLICLVAVLAFVLFI